ncbi:hypothetical protein, partial [Ciceribacter sp. RN22]|uniref:hypothetical protein n=1 Tax=Ciceribacter sp. RN22 TaxID=2954932 RepID=UPI0020923E67
SALVRFTRRVGVGAAAVSLALMRLAAKLHPAPAPLAVNRRHPAGTGSDQASIRGPLRPALVVRPHPPPRRC